MKEKKEDKMLRDLFRHKLENAEVIPSPSVGTNLMRRLGRREFLHFNPARFNIWYAGGIVVAGAALALLLTSGPDKKSKESFVPSSVETSQSVIPDNLKSGLVQGPGTDQSNNAQTNVQQGRKSSKKISGEGDTISDKQDNVIRRNRITSKTDIVSSLPEQKLLTNVTDDKNKLRDGLRIRENLIEASAIEGCTPLKVMFKNTAVAYDSCHWTFGDGGYSTEKAPVWLFDVPGEYRVILNVFGKDGSKSVSASVVTVFPRPVARFEITPENAILPENEISFHNYSTYAMRYKWDFGDGNTSELFEPKKNYRKFGNYNVKLVVISESGCSDSLVVMNAYSGSGYFIDFPNAFIPNANGPSGGFYSPKSDEASQVFHPFYSGVSDYQLRVFSRRGILIFESNDVNIGWDGYFKGQLSEPGVYIWKVRGSFMSGEPFTRMGDVTLLKN